MWRVVGASVWCPAFAGMMAWLAISAAFSDAPEALKNHYNDPFVQVTSAIKNCPQPRGPFMTVKEAQAEAHPRIERGTTCFMSGKCTEPNAYRYDARIALAAQDAVRRALSKTPYLAQSSVWLTVQRRFVFVHGCVVQRGDAARWEALMRAVPEVEYAGVDLLVMPSHAANSSTVPSRVPYPVMPAVPVQNPLRNLSNGRQ